MCPAPKNSGRTHGRVSRESNRNDSPIRERISKSVTRLTSVIEQAILDALDQVVCAKDEAVRRIADMAPVADFDLPQAAKYLGVSKRTLQRRVTERSIAYRREGGRLRFTLAALDEYRLAGTIGAREGRPLPT